MTSLRLLGTTWLAAGALGCALQGCASAANGGPSRLAGQELDAAVALYGNYVERIELDGGPTYIWRRTLIVGEQPRVCELRVQLGFRKTIRRAFMQGQPDACQLYAVKYEALTK